MNARQQAIETAREWMKRHPLFLDTETTGLDYVAEACEIAVLDAEGLTVFHSLVKPTHPIPATATSLHGITNAMVEGAPTFAEIAPTLWEKLSGHLVIAYNASYDSRILMQSQRAAKAPSLNDAQGWMWGCAMELYARFQGDWDPRHHSYRWWQLGSAAGQCRVTLPANLHRAQADAEMCRLIVIYMASQKETL